MIYWHMCELVKQGHKPILIGHPECEVESQGITLIPQNTKEWWKQIPKGIDAIQLFYNFIPPVDIPTLVMIGGNGTRGEEFPLNTVFVGKKHAENHNSQSYIHNAIDLREYPFQPKSQHNWDSFLFLAKAKWSVKNVRSAIRACKKSQKSLNIIGGNYLLPSRYIKGHGMVGGEKKIEIIRKCDALIFPVRWEEPFGLAIIEAMSQGLPVIGTPYGSLPELINQDVGVIIKSENELIEALISKNYIFNPTLIRNYVESHFNISIFTQKNVEALKKIINGEILNPSKPTWSLKYNPNDLLAF